MNDATKDLLNQLKALNSITERIIHYANCVKVITYERVTTLKQGFRPVDEDNFEIPWDSDFHREFDGKELVINLSLLEEALKKIVEMKMDIPQLVNAINEIKQSECEVCLRMRKEIEKRVDQPEDSEE